MPILARTHHLHGSNDGVLTVLECIGTRSMCDVDKNRKEQWFAIHKMLCAHVDRYSSYTCTVRSRPPLGLLAPNRQPPQRMQVHQAAASRYNRGRAECAAAHSDTHI
jgi:hypothetical protein